MKINKLFVNLKYSFSPNCENGSFSRAINSNGNDMEINWQVIEKITSKFSPRDSSAFSMAERRSKSLENQATWRILVDSSQIHSPLTGQKAEKTRVNFCHFPFTVGSVQFWFLKSLFSQSYERVHTGKSFIRMKNYPFVEICTITFEMKTETPGGRENCTRIVFQSSTKNWERAQKWKSWSMKAFVGVK